MSKQINIISRHATLSEAVKAAGYDLSYNEKAAQQSIRDTETGFGRKDQGAQEAFVTDDGVYYIYKCDLTLLNKFDPFISCLHDGDFRLVHIGEDFIKISGDSLGTNRREIRALYRNCVVTK